MTEYQAPMGDSPPAQEIPSKKELVAIIDRLASRKRAVRDAAERELETLSPAAIGALSLLVMPEWRRRVKPILYVLTPYTFACMFLQKWLIYHNLDWIDLVLIVPLVVYSVPAIMGWLRVLFAWEPIKRVLRRHSNAYPYSLWELLTVRTDNGPLLKRIRELTHMDDKVLTHQDRQTLIYILDLESPSWKDVRLAAFDALEVVGDGSELRVVRNVAKSGHVFSGAEKRALAERAARLIPLLEERARERESNAQLLRASQAGAAAQDLLHPTLQPGNADLQTLLRGAEKEQPKN